MLAVLITVSLLGVLAVAVVVSRQRARGAMQGLEVGELPGPPGGTGPAGGATAGVPVRPRPPAGRPGATADG